MITIFDYGINNLFSLKNIVSHCGFEVLITNKKEEIINSDGMILPGVGSFPEGMNKLIENNYDKTIYEYIDTGKPLLAICLGFQMLFSQSIELNEKTKGLDIIKGEILKIPKNKNNKIPHVGWNKVLPVQKNDIIKQESPFYFVHSFYAKPLEDRFKLTKTYYYDLEFCSSILLDNVFGCQFHPEKSGADGIKLISSYFKNV
jgi:imidazole glycerol-phosphate synthase subunit HisH